MSLWKKRPIVIEAVQFTGENFDEVLGFTGSDAYRNNDQILIQTLEGLMTASIGDFIIQGVAGEFYPCKAEIFHASYESAV